jgi:hypothetical protein
LSVALTIALVAGAATLVPRAADAQQPSSATPLPGLMSAMVVDSAMHHVFVSLHDTGKIAVLDFNGKLLSTISGETGAGGLALVGSDLYAVAANGTEIDDINTVTLTRTRTLASGFTSIGNLVSAAGALWAIQGTGGLLTRVALTDGSTKTYPNPTAPYAAFLATDPANANTLISYGEAGPVIGRVDVSTDPPTLPAFGAVFGSHDVAVSPDGTHVVVAGNSVLAFDEFKLSDLQSSGVAYPGLSSTNAIAMTSAGGGLLAGGMHGNSTTDVLVYRLGQPGTAVATADFGTPSADVESGGLAFSPDGSRLFAVSASGGSDVFHVVTLFAPALTVSITAIAYGAQRVGTYGPGVPITIKNGGNLPATLSLALSGADPSDYFGDTDCFPSSAPSTLAVGASCHVTMYFAPVRLGGRSASLVVRDGTSALPVSVPMTGSGTEGYFLADSRGEVANFGDAVFHGSTSGVHLAAPMISLATTPNGAGYWLLARDGGIFSFGNAEFYGSTGAIRLNKPIVAMTPTRTGRGYWLVASDGGIFSFGDARFHGSTGAMHLNQPIVGMAATPSGHGYWLVASDGGIFSFGDAKFYGSTGNIHLARPITSMATTATGRGYEFVASDGGVFTFGDARYYGSAAGTGATIVGIASTPTGHGYWMATNTGTVFAFGDAPFDGDAHATGVNDVIGIAGTAPPVPPDLAVAVIVGPADAATPIGAATADRARGTIIATR